MKKKTAYLALTAALVFGISVPCSAAGAGSNTADISALRSRNTLIYQSAEGSVGLYSDDIMLLADKISTIPNKTFDPGIYTHVYDEEHLFEEMMANEDNLHHTIKCISCGCDKVEECNYTDCFETDGNAAEMTWCCQCGKKITEPYIDDDMDADSDVDADTDTGIGIEAEPDEDFSSNPDEYQENGDSHISAALTYIYISNQDGTHQVIQGEDILETAEICNLIADPETYDDATGQAVYTCELCNYSIADTYNPDKKE